MILSIDASTHSTGWAIFDGQKLIDYGCITSSKSHNIERIIIMASGIDEILNNYPKVDKVIMEEVLPKNEDYDDGATHHSNPKVFKPLMWLQAAINFNIYFKHNKIPVEFIMPNSWRSKCGISTGRGVHRETLKAKDIKFVKDTFNLDVNDDTADAIGIGWSQVNNKTTNYDWSN